MRPIPVLQYCRSAVSFVFLRLVGNAHTSLRQAQYNILCRSLHNAPSNSSGYPLYIIQNAARTNVSEEVNSSRYLRIPTAKRVFRLTLGFSDTPTSVIFFFLAVSGPSTTTHMPSSGYSELANWNGSQSGTRPKSQDSSPNTLSTSTSTASAQSRAKPSGKPLEYTTTEILSSRNAAGSKDTVVGKASSLPRANVSVSVVRAKSLLGALIALAHSLNLHHYQSSLKSLAASTNVTVHEDSLPDAESGLTSKTSSPKEVSISRMSRLPSITHIKTGLPNISSKNSVHIFNQSNDIQTTSKQKYRRIQRTASVRVARQSNKWRH